MMLTYAGWIDSDASRDVNDDLSWCLPTLGKCRIHFWDGGTHWTDCYPNDRVIMKMIVIPGDLQFNIGSNTEPSEWSALPWDYTVKVTLYLSI
jgi:hypothetical protein